MYKKLTALTLASSIVVVSTYPAVYYVNPRGKDSNPGTIEEPWQTIQKAAQQAIAGDTVIVQTGEYSGSINVSNHSGTVADPIVFLADGKVRVLGGYFDIGTYSVPRHYIHVNGFHFKDVSMTIRGSYNLIENCIFEGPRGGFGISWHPSLDPPSSNVIVRSNVFVNFGQVVVMNTGAKSENIVIEGNIFENIEGDVLRFFGRNHVFRKNIVKGVRETGFHADIFQVYDNNLEPSFGMLIECNQFLDSTGSLCMVLNRGQSLIGNWTWRNNVIVSVDGVAQIAAPYFKFHNNTFVNSGKNTAGPILLRHYGDSAYAFAHNTEIVNNMFIGCGSYPDADGVGWYHFADRPEADFYGFIADFNYVAKSQSAGYASKKGFQGKELNGINGGDPCFIGVSDFRLRSESRAVDTGKTIGSFAHDFDTVLRPQGSAWDRGAFERLQTGQPIRPPAGVSNLRIQEVR